MTTNSTEGPTHIDPDLWASGLHTRGDGPPGRSRPLALGGSVLVPSDVYSSWLRSRTDLYGFDAGPARSYRRSHL